jgi:hypothetical protein
MVNGLLGWFRRVAPRPGSYQSMLVGDVSRLARYRVGQLAVTAKSFSVDREWLSALSYGREHGLLGWFRRVAPRPGSYQSMLVGDVSRLARYRVGQLAVTAKSFSMDGEWLDALSYGREHGLLGWFSRVAPRPRSSYPKLGIHGSEAVRNHQTAAIAEVSSRSHGRESGCEAETLRN